MLIIKNGKGPERSIRREELLIESGLPQLLFDNILKSLERNGYIIYDAYSNEVKLRSDTWPK